MALHSCPICWLKCECSTPKTCTHCPYGEMTDWELGCQEHERMQPSIILRIKREPPQQERKVFDVNLLSALTSHQFERNCLPSPIKYGTSVQIPTYNDNNQQEAIRTIDLTLVQFADGQTAWIGYDEVGDLWFWRKAQDANL